MWIIWTADFDVLLLLRSATDIVCWKSLNNCGINSASSRVTGYRYWSLYTMCSQHFLGRSKFKINCSSSYCKNWVKEVELVAFPLCRVHLHDTKLNVTLAISLRVCYDTMTWEEVYFNWRSIARNRFKRRSYYSPAYRESYVIRKKKKIDDYFLRIYPFWIPESVRLSFYAVSVFYTLKALISFIQILCGHYLGI